jgi:hypothetical protein
VPIQFQVTLRSGRATTGGAGVGPGGGVIIVVEVVVDVVVEEVAEVEGPVVVGAAVVARHWNLNGTVNV